MFDDGGHDDQMAEDGIWGATITIDKGKEKPVQYFLSLPKTSIRQLSARAGFLRSIPLPKKPAR